jgi:hypothetical protein
MGSVVKLNLAPIELKTALIQTFAKFEDYNFIVKVDASDEDMVKLASTASNIYLESWLPQVDVLGM